MLVQTYTCYTDIYIYTDTHIHILFADDTNIFFNGDDAGLVFLKAQHFLRKVTTYTDSDTNYLHIHLKRSKCILFKSPRSQ